jgi:transcriptional regulator with XRE-family HTH domain
MKRKNIVGLRIRKARKETGITQQKLATKLQLMNIMIDRSAIAKIEIGIRPASDVEIAAISRILKFPVSWFFDDSDEFFRNLE